MQYTVEVIGKEFSDKAVKALEANLNAKHGQGYRFHSVFEVSQPGCGPFGQASVTYIAVFEKI